MKCPHCGVAMNFEAYECEAFQEKDFDQTKMAYKLVYGHCPECDEFISLLRRGLAKREKGQYTTHLSIYEIKAEEIIFPKYIARKVEPEVPERYRKDYLEASSVLSLSPKASAAISRRLLQDILREHFKIKHPSLAPEIDEFIKLKDVPSYLSEAVDAIRNVGNFAAHPLKDTNTGEIVDVEPGEAEWLLEVLDSLFDFAFVQPKRLEEKKKRLNKKLQDMAKPPMKG